jgi:hypothetical protein
MGTGIQIVPDTGWTLPTLATDITVDGTRIHLGYRKRNGVVFCVLALAVASAAADKLLFTLPAGYRLGGSPGYALVPSGVVTSVGSVRLYPNGEVRTNSASTTSISGGFSFLAGA